MDAQVASTMLLPVSVDPPTKIADVPHSTATSARCAATSGDCLSGSISVMCLVSPPCFESIGKSDNHKSMPPDFVVGYSVGKGFQSEASLLISAVTLSESHSE